MIDTGIGITEANLARIFEDFVTLDASYRRTNAGTGLGLGIARRMVRAMGGEIGVESEPGEGSLFWIRLPLAPPTDAGSAPLGLRVLLVEDNQINRFVARGMLERDGHTVTEAIDGAEGLAAAERERFDLIVMDVSMPHLDGVSATRNIRSGSGPSAATPILGLTAHAQPAEVARFRAAGMTEVLHKPVLQGELTRMIARALGTTATAPGAAAASLPTAEETLPLIDPQISGELRDAIGAQSHAQLRDALVGEAKRFFTQPHDDVGHAAHRLAGSAAVLGARALHRHLQSVELAAADPATLPRSLELAAACWKDTLPLLLPEHADRH